MDWTIEFNDSLSTFYIYNAKDNIKFKPVYCNAAGIYSNLFSSKLLWLITMAQGWEYLSFGILPLNIEIETWQHSPRILLPNNTILSEERWFMDSKVIEFLKKLKGPKLFLAWRKEIDKRKIPDIVYVNWEEYDSDILLITNSPFAIELLFIKIYKKEIQYFKFKEIPGDLKNMPIKDKNGQNYISELAFCWNNRHKTNYTNE